MGKELPKNWIDTSVKEVSNLIRGVSYKKKDAKNINGGNDFLILRGGNIQDGKIINSEDQVFVNNDFVKDEQKIIKGDVVIVGSTGSKKLIGKAGIAHENLNNTSFGAFLMLIRPKNEINKSYFDYFFLSDQYREEIRVLAGGININNIRRQYIEDMSFPLPPLPEQNCIVTKLDQLFGQLELMKASLDNIPQLLKNFRQQVLTYAFTGKLTDEWRNRMRLDSFRMIELGELLIDSPKNGAYYPNSLYGSGTRIIRIDSFYDGELKYWDKVQKVEISENDYETYKLEQHDILINRVNSLNYLGKCMLVEDLLEPAIFESNMMRLKIDKKKIIPKYLSLFLTSSIGTFELRKSAKHAVNQASINQTDVKNVIVNITSLKEQIEIVKRVESLFSKADSIEKNYENLKEKINNLPQTILHKAFKGELVPQLKSDGDAKDLLEDIKKLKRK